MPLRRRHQHRMAYSDRKRIAYGHGESTVQDQPVAMKDYEESVLEEGMKSRHDRVELFDANRYRRKRAITKIFRDSRYAPRLDDIEELDENATENEIYVALVSSAGLSLNSLHKERLRNHGGKVRRSRSKRRHSVSATKNTLSEMS